MSLLSEIGGIRRNVKLFLFATTLYGLAFTGIYSLLFNLYLVRLGYGPEFIGTSNSVASLGFAFFSLVAGALGYKFGPRFMMLAAVILCVVAVSVVGGVIFVAPTIRTALLIFGHSLAWASFGIYVVNAAPFLMSTSDEKERPLAFSLYFAVLRIAAFLGGVLGGLLPPWLDRVVDGNASTSYALSIECSLMLLIPAFILLVLTDRVEISRSATHGRRVDTGVIALIGFVGAFGVLSIASEGTLRTFFNVYLDTELGISTTSIGILFALGQLISVPAVLFYPALARQLGNFRTIAYSTAGSVIWCLPLVFLPHWLPGALGFAAVIALGSVLRTALNVYTQELVAEPWRPIISGVLMMSLGVSTSAMSAVGGLIAGSAGYRPVFGIGAVLTSIAFVFFLLYFRRPRGEYSRAR